MDTIIANLKAAVEFIKNFFNYILSFLTGGSFNPDNEEPTTNA